MSNLLADRLCAVVAAEVGQDPIGSAGSVSRLLAIEIPTPWGDDLYKADPEGTMVQRINAKRREWREKALARGDWEDRIVRGIPQIYGIQPDREWSQPDVRRVLVGTKPEGLFNAYEMAEYAFPLEAPELLELAEMFLEPASLERFDAFRVANGGHREFFVCTHGHVDICCAKFGIPLYNHARAAYPTVRAWRMTHFGGHRYAPTAWEFPAGYKWAFLDDEATDRVLSRDRDVADLMPNLRGWNGAEGQSQLLDREGLRRFGWRWLEFRRRGWVLESDTEAQRWRVKLEFESPEGERGVFEGVVAVGREIHEVGCGPHAGDYDFQIPEYVLESFL